MSQDKRSQFFDEIFANSHFSRCGGESNESEPKTKCDCMEHNGDSDSTLRSGNYVTCILQRTDTPEYHDVDGPIWTIEYVACFDCPVASLYERVEKTAPIAIVEGEFTRGEDCLVLEPRYIWDLHLPDEQSVDV